MTYRDEFEIPRDICYLNNAYMGPQPRRVLEATQQGAIRRSRPWTITPADFFDGVETLRASFARIVGCSAENIAIVPSCGYGISTAANNLSTSQGDIVLALADQFPANYYAWRRQALSTGAEIQVVDKEPGQSWADALLTAIERHGESIAIAALEGHHWASAEVIDLDVVLPALREVGAKVVLDLTQTIGGCPIDIGELAPDFMATAAYKWQFCPYGIGFLYVADEYLDGMPLEEPWMSRDGAEDFSRLSEFTDKYQPGARRYDMSEKANFSNIAGAVAALQMLEEWGVGMISETLADTNERIAGILEQHGFESTPANARAPHFQGARLPATDPRALAAKLAENRVYASVRGDHLRIAPHLYTDKTDLGRLDEVLRAALS